MKGFVYAIINMSDEIIYVGSTRQRLMCMRKGDHTKPGKTHKQPIHTYIEENGGWTNFTFKILEDCEVETNKNLLEREKYYYELHKPKMNILRPITTIEERRADKREDAKRFRETHPDYHKRYAEKVKEYDRKRCATTIECSCGKSYKAQNKSNHIRTKYHQEKSSTLAVDVKN